MTVNYVSEQNSEAENDLTFSLTSNYKQKQKQNMATYSVCSLL